MSKDYPNKIFQRVRQRAQLIMANPNFQKEVLEIRRKFKIPLQGFKDEKLNEKWHDDFYASGDKYFETVWQKRSPEIAKLRAAKKFREANELQKQLNQETPINALRIAVKKILKEYKLPLNWEHSIHRLILFNSIDLMWLPGNVTIKEEMDQDTDLVKLFIGIDDSTTLEDIRRAWPIIKFHQKKLESYTKKKFQPIKNFERDQEVYNLKQSGKSYNEIADKLSKKYNKVVSSEDIASYIKRHKQKTGIN
jgi:hypothetical protein